jgi:hypothetical protein
MRTKYKSGWRAVKVSGRCVVRGDSRKLREPKPKSRY